MKKNTKFIVGGIVLLIAILIGFGGSENRDLNSNQFGGHSALDTAPEGDFTLKSLDGRDITLSDYVGEKPVILDFWASWCPNCRRDMPNLSRFYEKYKEDVEVIGVNLQEREATVKKYIDNADIKFPIVLDPNGSAARSFGANYTNYHVLINKDGSIAGTVPGDISEAQVVALIEAQK